MESFLSLGLSQAIGVGAVQAGPQGTGLSRLQCKRVARGGLGLVGAFFLAREMK